MARHSNLQKQVLSLYKQFLQAGREKPGFLPRIQYEFRKNAKIPRSDVMHIEYLLRRGWRQLEQLKDVNTKQLGAFIKTSQGSIQEGRRGMMQQLPVMSIEDSSTAEKETSDSQHT